MHHEDCIGRLCFDRAERAPSLKFFRIEWGPTRRCRGHVQAKTNRKAGSKKAAAAAKKKGIGPLGSSRLDFQERERCFCSFPPP